MQLVFKVCIICRFVTPLSQVRKMIEYSKTCLTLPHTLCASPKSIPCNPGDVCVLCYLVTHVYIVDLSGRYQELLHLNIVTLFFCGLLQLTVWCWYVCPLLKDLGQPVDVCPLLKALGQPVGVCPLLKALGQPVDVCN